MTCIACALNGSAADDALVTGAILPSIDPGWRGRLCDRHQATVTTLSIRLRELLKSVPTSPPVAAQVEPPGAHSSYCMHGKAIRFKIDSQARFTYLRGCKDGCGDVG